MAVLNPQRYGIVALTVITALIHLVLGFGFLGTDTTFAIVFILNGIGYLALIAGLYFVPQLADQRANIRWVLLAFTAVTFVLYFVFNWPDVWSPFGLFDKAVELILIVLLWMDQ